MKEKVTCYTCRFCKIDNHGYIYCSLRKESGHCINFDKWESQKDVLDKIRVEIEQYQSDYDVHGTEYDRTAWKAFNRCLQIIDKYKADNEVDDGNDD